MVGIYRYGNREVGFSDETVSIGDATNSFFLSPTRIFVYSSSEDDKPSEQGASQLLLSGIGSGGKRVSEFLSLNGQENSFSKLEYTFIDTIKVRGGNSNKGNIVIKSASGVVVGQLNQRSNILQKAEYGIGNKDGVGIVGYGGAAQVAGKSEPVRFELVRYNKGKRSVIHSMAVDSLRSSVQEKVFLNPLQTKVGEIISVEASTGGSPVKVDAWLELNEE